MNLTSADIIHINGRAVYTFSGIPGFDPRTLKGKSVIIDEHIFRVVSVETFALRDATGFSFGLMVEDETPNTKKVSADTQ